MKTNYYLVKIDHHEATIYHLGDNEGKVDIEKPYDPNLHRFHLHHKNNFKWKGQYAAEDHHEFKEIFEIVKDAEGIVLASNGSGKSNEGAHFEAWVKKHHHQTNENFFLSSFSIANLTESQLLAKADQELGLKHKRQ